MSRVKKNRFILPAIICSVIFLPVHLGAKWWLNLNSPSLLSVKQEETLDNFTLTDLEGVSKTLDEIIKDKKLTIISFWLTTCSICRPELTHLTLLQKKFKDDGLNIVTVNIDQDRQPLLEFSKRTALSLPVYFDPKHLMEAKIGLTGVPAAVVIDHKRRIRSVFIGTTTRAEEGIKNLLERVNDENETEEETP